MGNTLAKHSSARKGGKSNSSVAAADSIEKANDQPTPTTVTSTGTCTEKEETTQRTENEKFIEKWVDCWDRHDLNTLDELISPQCDYHFPETEVHMPQHEFRESMEGLYAAFPDIRFGYESIKEIQPGVVVLKDYYGHGHHTGEPYGFGPYPPMEAKGTYVKDEPITITLKITDGKVVDCSVESFGNMTGPPGFYTKIGGILF